MKVASAFGRALAEAGLPRGYIPCAGLALAAIWGHHYPAGIDLPQHANLVRLWVELRQGPVEYGAIYRVNAFTPYLLAYAIAYPLTKWFGALTAVKFVLSLAALGTPWTMARWLRTVGGAPALGLVGFPVVFGFAYLWGFLSHCLALPLLFGYLASFERQGEQASGWQIFRTTCWGAALFFCHGVTFGVAVVSAGIRVLARRHPLGALSAAVHLVPLGGLTLLWLRLREARASADTHWWFIDGDRLVTLFSGLFWPKASLAWGAVTALALAIVWLAARPSANRSLGAWVPFLIAAAGFVILPEYLASTYLVGTRFSVYVQAFAPALCIVASARAVRRLEIATTVLVASSLVLLNVRLYRFNVELDGFRELAARVEPYADVQTYLTKLGGDSDAFGPRELSEIPAWVSADNGGLIENDSARYFQMPVQRRGARPPRRYRYVFARGPLPRVTSRMSKAFPDAVVRERSGSWFLFERGPLQTGAVEVVRSTERDPRIDSSADDAPLSVGGVVFDHGLGAYPRSLVRVRVGTRPPEDASTFEGACGVDDSAPDGAKIAFRIRGEDGRIVFNTGPMAKGAAAVPFSVPLDDSRELVLEALARGGPLDGDYADWVDLR